MNNIKYDDSDAFMKRVRNFTDAVMEQSRRCHPQNPSTINFATLLYPPQFCWFPGDGPVPHDVYQNKLPMMTLINNKIITHNDKTHVSQLELYKTLCDGEVYTKSRSPGFHTYGLRKTNVILPNGRRVGMKGHRWESWRESEPVDRKLHLEARERVRMATAVNKFFMYQFKGNNAQSRN